MIAMVTSEYGRVVSLRYFYQDGSVQAVLPMYTISDDGKTYVGYMPAGTQIMYWALEDGTDPRTVPLAERFLRPMTTAPRVWEGNGVLRVIPRGENFQVIHFWDDRGFAGWYINLESTKTDRDGFIDAVDWHLDLWIDPQRRPQWKDVEEADMALAAGHLTQHQLDQAWATAHAVVDQLGHWPTSIGDWSEYTPPSNWRALPLPEHWKMTLAPPVRGPGNGSGAHQEVPRALTDLGGDAQRVEDGTHVGGNVDDQRDHFI